MGTVTTSYDARFWLDNDDYQEFAKTFERNIEIEHPDNYSCDLFHGSTGHCAFCASKVTYYRKV